MNRRVALVCVLIVACTSLRKPERAAQTILDCQTLFTSSASLTQLQSVFGASNIAAGSVPLGDVEGEVLPASVLFPNDPTRRIAVVWRDTLNKRSPRFVYLDRPSEWRTPEGITIGTSLIELERLNNKPFQLAGFAFDEAGAVISWEGGRLERDKTGSCRVHVWLDSISASRDSAARSYNQVTGDRTFSSQHPAMQSLNPRVSRLLLFYP
jgi:hypothetical protein